MSDRTNADAMTELLERVKTPEGFATVSELFADDVAIVQDFMFPGQTWTGREEVEALWTEMEEGFTDIRLAVRETVREADKIVLFGHFEGIFTGEQYGADGHGKPVRWEFRDTYYFRDGEMVKIDFVNDTLTVALMTGLLDEDPRPTA